MGWNGHNAHTSTERLLNGRKANRINPKKSIHRFQKKTERVYDHKKRKFVCLFCQKGEKMGRGEKWSWLFAHQTVWVDANPSNLQILGLFLPKWAFSKMVLYLIKLRKASLNQFFFVLERSNIKPMPWEPSLLNQLPHCSRPRVTTVGNTCTLWSTVV